MAQAGKAPHDRLARFVEPCCALALRVTLGIILLTHGWPKLTGQSHGSMKDPWGGTVALVRDRLRLPAPEVFAWLVTALETAGAGLLIAGLLTRVVSAAVCVEMLVISAMFWPVWAWNDHGAEYPFLMGVVALAVAARGGDRYSLDRAFFGRGASDLLSDQETIS